MSRKLLRDRPVLNYDVDRFGSLLGRVLSPARPLQSEEFLRGRHEVDRDTVIRVARISDGFPLTTFILSCKSYFGACLKTEQLAVLSVPSNLNWLCRMLPMPWT